MVGWLLVGVYMQRRQFARQAMNAGRAVYFELLINRMSRTKSNAEFLMSMNLS